MRFIRILAYHFANIFYNKDQNQGITESMTGCPVDEKTNYQNQKMVNKIRVLQNLNGWPKCIPDEWKEMFGGNHAELNQVIDRLLPVEWIEEIFGFLHRRKYEKEGDDEE